MSTVLDRLLISTLSHARVKVRRSRRQWCEQDLHIPDGPFKGERFRVARQPFTGLLLDELDSGRWVETFVCGPSQTGKTLIGHVAPAIYTLAELRQNCVVAMPDMRMAQNKWEIDFKPVFEASPILAGLLPTRGPGSHGGLVKDHVRLENGAVLKFMTAGGDDTQRAGFTAEGGVYVTEAARFSSGGESSVEADPIDQLRARMQALERRHRRLVVEGTATIEAELPWSAREQSSQSAIVLPCPHCGEWVTLEREHLVGWRDAANEIEAAERAHYCCPKCVARWTEQERRSANLAAKLLHKGQRIDERGEIVGDPPRTERLWFRWTMGNNLLLSAADVAVDEWKAAQLDPESDAGINAEKKLCQFVWARPYVQKLGEFEPLTIRRVLTRQDELSRGICPPDTDLVTIGIDLGKWIGHYVVTAWRLDGRGHVVDYGAFDVPSQRDESDKSGLDVRLAIKRALSEIRDRFENVGWTVQHGGDQRLPDKVLIDYNYETDAVAEWCGGVAAGDWCTWRDVYSPCQGRGTGQHERRQYSHPQRTGGDVIGLGEQYFVARDPGRACHRVEVHANYWKSWIHERMRTPRDQRGALTIFSATEREHLTFAKHLAAERQVEKHVDGHGMVRVWENTSKRANHLLDALVYACVAGHLAGWRITSEPRAQQSGQPVEAASTGIVMPDGRDFFATMAEVR